MSYEKSKRKNEDERGSLIGWFVRGLWRYSVVLPLQGTWWLTKQTARVSWWLTKNAAQVGWTASVWAVNAPLRLLTWMWYAIMGLPPEFETQRETNIYRLIRRRTRRRTLFTLHSMFYSLGMLVSVVAIISIFRNSTQLGFDPYNGVSSTAAFVVTWTLVWMFHFMHKRAGDSEDRELQEALDREYGRQKRTATAPIYDDYYRERLAVDEVDHSDNHNVAYYEDDSDYKPARKR